MELQLPVAVDCPFFFSGVLDLSLTDFGDSDIFAREGWALAESTSLWRVRLSKWLKRKKNINTLSLVTIARKRLFYRKFLPSFLFNSNQNLT